MRPEATVFCMLQADLLELEAEAALLDSERAIEQHLLDFPADNQDS